MRKRILFSVLFAFFAVGSFAQGQGLAGINEATSMLTSYFDPATKLCYAIGAVLGLQVGQLPVGLLNEKSLGSSLGTEYPQ